MSHHLWWFNETLWIRDVLRTIQIDPSSPQNWVEYFKEDLESVLTVITVLKQSVVVLKIDYVSDITHIFFLAQNALKFRCKQRPSFAASYERDHRYPSFTFLNCRFWFCSFCEVSKIYTKRCLWGPMQACVPCPCKLSPVSALRISSVSFQNS